MKENNWPSCSVFLTSSTNRNQTAVFVSLDSISRTGEATPTQWGEHLAESGEGALILQDAGFLKRRLASVWSSACGPQVLQTPGAACAWARA